MYLEPSPLASPSRLSTFLRKPRSGGSAVLGLSHARSSSLNLPGHCPSPSGSTTRAPGTPSTWRWRPSVLGHFSMQNNVPAVETQLPYNLPRESTSSCTSDDDCVPGTPRQTYSLPSHGSSKLFKYGTGSASSPSLWSQPTTLSVSSTCPDAAPGSESLAHKASTIRVPFASKRKSHLGVNVINGQCDDDDDDSDVRPLAYDPTVPYVAYSNTGSTRLSLSSLSSATRMRKKKKRLIIRGIDINEGKKFEAAKRWCEVSCLDHSPWIGLTRCGSIAELR
jgi:hypothetical protein